MSPRDRKLSDFENRFLDAIEDDIHELKELGKSLVKKLDHNTRKTEEGFKSLNGRVGKLEDEVFPVIARTAKDLPAWYRDPQVLKIIGYVALGALVALGAFTNVDLTRFL